MTFRPEEQKPTPVYPGESDRILGESFSIALGSYRDSLALPDPETYIEKYGVSDTLAADALREFPSLCYLLGSVSAEPQGQDSRPDGVEKDYFLLKEGSGMFNLAQPDDARRWKGMFNHVLGTTRQVHYLAERLSELSPEQIAEFGERGFDVASIANIDPAALRDAMLVSHCGRRQHDEYVWHGVRDEAHKYSGQGRCTRRHLKVNGCSKRLLDILETACGSKFLPTAKSAGGIQPDMILNITSWCDWTFGQQPISLDDRFKTIKARGGPDMEVFDRQEAIARKFQDALEQIVSPNIFEEMTSTPMPDWEKKLREAYCSPSGLDPAEVF